MPRGVTRLEPHVGESRHGGEDHRAVGQPVVWLDNTPTVGTCKDRGVYTYRHEVEVDPADPLLHEDERFTFAFGGFTSQRWYICRGSLDVCARSIWNGATCVPDPTFYPTPPS